MKKRVLNNNLYSLVFSAALFAAFAFLVWLFPYSGDDWGWGSQIGMERLETWFADYNGRYAGNLLVMALTRSKALAMLTVGLSMLFVCLLPKLFSRGRGLLPYAMGAVLFLCVPVDVFAQAVVWTSGYSNYVPPILLTVLYFITVSNVFDSETPRYKPYTGAVCAVLGFVGALFMENLTVFNIVISLVIAVGSFKRFGRFYTPHILYFAGSVAGAVLMFSNSAYGLIVRGDDFYRTTCVERGVFDTVTENFKEFFEHMFAENIISLGVLSLLLVFLYRGYKAKNSGESKSGIALKALGINLLCFAAALCKNRLYDWDFFFENSGYALVSTLIMALVVLLYMASLVVLVCICIENGSLKNKALLLIFSIALTVAPLMLVNPVGPRCFFPPYFLLSCLTVTVLTYLLESTPVDAFSRRRLVTLSASACAVILAFLFGVYATVHSYDVRRTEYVRKQVDAGFKNVVLYYLPFSDYVWNGDPDSEPWYDHYRKFYAIEDDVKFKFILRESFEDFADNFEQ